MTANRDLIKKTQIYAVEDRKLSWTYLINSLLILALLITGTTAPFPLPVRILIGIVAGLVIVRIFIIYHDFQHGAIFKDSVVGKFLLDVFGLLVLNPPSVWRRSHNYHHQHNAQIATAAIGSFPVMTVEQYARAGLFERVIYKLARHPVNILFGYFTIFLLGMCLGSFLKDKKRHLDSLGALILHFALIFIIYSYGGIIALFVSFIIPIFVACCVGAYLFYIQHNFPSVKLQPRTEWNYVRAALESSSFMDSNAIVHWFTGNIGFHHVHHLNPSIPFYNLPKAMREVAEFQNPGRTNLTPLEIYKCFSLKLWDPESNKMIGYL